MTQVPLPTSLSVPTSGAATAPSGPIGFIERRPAQAFAAFLALHVIVWTTLPALLYANLPLDLIEALTYGREWQLGYDKLPPLPWWLTEIMYRAFGSDAAYYALAQVTVVVAFVAVWATARSLVGTRGALVAVLIIDGMHYLQYTAVKFNHDVIQLPFWALSGYAFHAALKRGRLWHWLLLGFCIGAALWAKYFVVVLAVPYALFLLLDREARRAVATPGPWLAVVVAFIVMAPHLWWLVHSDFLPLAYAEHRAAPVRGWFDHLLHPALFAVSQIFFLLPSFFIAAALWWPRPSKTPLSRPVDAGARRHTGSDSVVPTLSGPASAPASPSDRLPHGGTDNTADAFDRRIVTLLAFGPGLTTIALGAVSGRGAVAMWGYPLWLYLGLWIVLNARSALNGDRLGRVVAAWGAVFAVFALAFVINYSLLPRFDHRYRAVFFPGDKLAAALTQRFHAASGQKLSYVIGSMWDGGNIAHYSPDHPRVLIDGLPRRAPWIDLYDLRAKGAVVVWTVGDSAHLPAQYAAVAGDATVGTPFDLPPRRGDSITHVGWAILKPQPHAAAPADGGTNGK
jgi:drug/metabolite transporter superfamily protein YnfA